jgi:hypothetical protein
MHLSQISNVYVLLSILITPKTNMLPLYQALAESQLQNECLIKAYHELHSKYQGLRASQPKGAKQCAVDRAKTLEDEEVKHLGKKYAIMVEPWVDKGVFVLRPEGIDTADPDNYGSELSIEQLRTEELYCFVPENFYNAIASSEIFRVKVCWVLCLHEHFH